MTAPRCSSRWSDIFHSLLQTLFPVWCVGCGARLQGREQWLCSACQAGLRYNDKVMPGNEETGWAAAGAVFMYGPAVRQLIHMLKYDDATRVARYLGHHAVRYMHEVWPHAMPDVVVPVPLHPTRQRERGYNQSLLLARAIASGLPARLEPTLVQRGRYTSSQTHLNREQRLQNVRDAFVRGAVDLTGRTVLVVDDVFTTGSTATAVARALLADGDARYGAAKQVFVLTIARA